MTNENTEVAATEVTTNKTDERAKGGKLPQILAYLAILGTYIAAVVLGNTKVSFTTGNGYTEVATAMSNYEVNDASSTTVYNQMVTNGWAAKDLLEAIGHQNATIIDNQNATAQLIQGTNALLTYGLGMVAVIGVAIIVAIYSKKKQQ